jgi:hypothetical protein
MQDAFSGEPLQIQSGSEWGVAALITLKAGGSPLSGGLDHEAKPAKVQMPRLAIYQRAAFNTARTASSGASPKVSCR